MRFFASLRASSRCVQEARREKEGELATTYNSLEFEEYLHRKSRCEMLIGRDDLVMTSLPLARVFQYLLTFAFVSASL